MSDAPATAPGARVGPRQAVVADRLYTRNAQAFSDRVFLRELPTCPPLSDRKADNNVNRERRWYAWNNRGRRILYEGAPFAVVRWTNLWYPARLRFFGDWFGGPLAPLFAGGITTFHWPAIAGTGCPRSHTLSISSGAISQSGVARPSRSVVRWTWPPNHGSARRLAFPNPTPRPGNPSTTSHH